MQRWSWYYKTNHAMGHGTHHCSEGEQKALRNDALCLFVALRGEGSGVPVHGYEKQIEHVPVYASDSET